MPDLNFDKQSTLYATHRLHAYAAKCPPPLVRYGLRYYSKPGEKVLDPMAGSGTTLVEARLMGRRALGYDIDPLACLIAQVKTRLISDTGIEQAYGEIAKRTIKDLTALRSARASAAVRRRADLPDFTNRDYWFSSAVSEALAVLSSHIANTQMSEPVRDFFWVAFSSLILARTSVANARDIIHSRHHFWEHSQPPDVLGKFSARVRLMRKQMAEFRGLCDEVGTVRVEARLGDARHLRLQAETIDLVFTSPPYVTALDYTRAHFLAVAWMRKALGVGLPAYREQASAYIGSERRRLNGTAELNGHLKQFDLAQSVVTRLAEQSPAQARLTQRYFMDMNQVLRKIAHVLKQRRHAIIVVCPSHIRKVEVPTHEVLSEIGRAHGLKLKRSHTRTISERRRLLPYIKESFGKRMDTEYVLVFQKTS